MITVLERSDMSVAPDYNDDDDDDDTTAPSMSFTRKASAT